MYIKLVDEGITVMFLTKDMRVMSFVFLWIISQKLCQASPGVFISCWSMLSITWGLIILFHSMTQWCFSWTGKTKSTVKSIYCPAARRLIQWTGQRCWSLFSLNHTLGLGDQYMTDIKYILQAQTAEGSVLYSRVRLASSESSLCRGDTIMWTPVKYVIRFHSHAINAINATFVILYDSH